MVWKGFFVSDHSNLISISSSFSSLIESKLARSYHTIKLSLPPKENKMPVAEIFLTAFVTVLIEKLAPSLLSKLARHEGIQTQLEKWSGTLNIIQAVLNDAEEKQLTDEAVRTWLDGLQVLAYDLDDILDDLITEAMRRESVKARQEASTSKVRRLLPTCCTSFTSPSAFLFDYNMGSKLAEITKRLEDLSNRKKDLGLIANVGSTKSYGAAVRETTSLVIESDIRGRENDKEEVLKLLFRDEKRDGEISVLPIVGMGGLGKTTLAQLVFNDDEVKGWFDLTIWVCVSDEFDVFTITKQILGVTEAVNLKDAQAKLKQKLSNKKFLLVLDDIWNEDYGKWDQLCTPLRVGAPGSVIIFTTRSERVAPITRNVPIYRLKELLDADCLSILAQHALEKRNFDEHPNFEIVAGQLVKKCKGLPLAAKAIGGLLRTKGTTEEWEDILNSKIWEFPEQPAGILPALRLSYHHLPPHLKRLFAYCSIFPADYEFDKYELVLLWMAEGFLQQPKGKKRTEEKGFEYFNELVSRSFFQPLSRGDESVFVMHDLMNDLAQFVAEGICYRLEDKMKRNEQYAQFGKARHSSFVRQEYGVFTKFEDYYRVRGLRTFLPLPVHKVDDWRGFWNDHLSSRVVNELLPQLRCLRVLSLSGFSITELSSSIGELKHLRYLNLSQTLITHLPEWVSDLYNLQVLSLRKCGKLCKLPTRIGNLVNLRHLDIGDTPELLEMPPGIGNLTSLQTLSKIIIDENNMLTLTELKGLSDLRGTIAIMDLHNVKNVQDAREANLSCKQGLEDLTLTWNSEFDDSRRNETLEYKVLEVLKPHTKLTKLKIVFYGGIEFPSWVCDPSFIHITNLTLRGCKNFVSLPSFGHLPSLKELFIEGMAGVKNVGDEFYGVGYPLFQSLETLKFENMVGWEEWSFNLTDTDEHVSAFPRLHNLSICDCPALVKISLPCLPSLQVLNIRSCNEVVLRRMVSVASLTTIEMDRIIGLSKLHERVVRSLGELCHLQIVNCDELRYLWEEESSCHNLVNLVDLSFDNCCKLEKLPDLENCLTSLKKLYIEACPRLQSFQTTTKLPTKEKELIESNSNNHIESSYCLEELSISGCESLTCFLPSRNLPTALQCLELGSCSNLEPESENFWLLNSSMSSLEIIDISNWVKLTSLPRCLPNFFHLADLILIGCPGIESFPERGFPPNLRDLKIVECKNLKSLPDDQMQSLTSLFSLKIVNCPCLESFPQGRWPPNLTRLSIGDIKQPISEWGLQRLPTSLVDFSIEGVFPGLVSFSDVGSQLPTSITQLWIRDLVSIESLSMGLQNLTSLQTLSIESLVSIESLSMGLQNLTSLQTLYLWRCPKLQSLPDLTSLQTLNISECPKLQSLPDTLLPTLSSLYILDCPLLKERCLKEKRDYWPRISHIPCVKIDRQLI